VKVPKDAMRIRRLSLQRSAFQEDTIKPGSKLQCDAGKPAGLVTDTQSPASRWVLSAV
jgi:hypothetical protein